MANKRKRRGQQRPARASRSEAKNEAARAALEPLARGERPTAVTVGAIVALLCALANVIAVVAGWNQGVDEDDRARALAYTVLATGVLLVVAWGMWKSKYWAVLGMQTLLALTLIASSLALVTVSSACGAILLVIIIAAAGTLFWFLVKAMARIQMPERPTRAR
jgi:cation transport ATPase